MNILADEGVDRPIVKRLRQSGHSVQYVAEMSPGITDDKVLELANQSSALLITIDKDFGELVFRQGRVSSGVMLIRLAGLPAEQKATVVVATVDRYLAELLGSFSVVTSKAVRIRRAGKR